MTKEVQPGWSACRQLQYASKNIVKTMQKVVSDQAQFALETPQVTIWHFVNQLQYIEESEDN